MKLRPGNAQHQGARDAQQDSFGFSDLDARDFVRHAGSLGVVADGMGGLAHGGAAGATAVRALLQAYAAKDPAESIPAALMRAVRQANEAVVQLARTTGQPDDVGTTIAAIVVRDAALHWIAVGDTRVYLWRGGRLTQVTADHVYAAELDVKVVAGQVSEQQARTDPDRDALTSHLGAARLRAVDRSVRPFPLYEGDRVLVCSDGLYRAMTLPEMAAPLADTPQRACETLIERAVAKRLPRQDNLTAIVIGLDADGITTATAHLTTVQPPDASTPPHAASIDPPVPDDASEGNTIAATASASTAARRTGGLARRLWRWHRRGTATLAWIVLAAMLGVAPWPAAAMAAAADLDDVPSAVVHLFVISTSGSIELGSGFLINDQSNIVTNHHVIALTQTENAAIFVMNEQEAARLAPTLQQPGKSSRDVYQYAIDHLPGARVVWSDAAQDLAILAPAAPVPGRALPLTLNAFVHIGDRVVAFGFPGLNRAMGTASLVTLDRRPGEITSQHVESARNRRVYASSVDTYQGMSGGPVANACGEVIGVVVGGFSRDVTDDKGRKISTETVNIFIQTDTLVPALTANKIPFTTATSPCVTGGSRGAPLTTARDPLLTGGVLTALAMGCAGLLLGLTRRGRSAVRAATDSVSRRLSRQDAVAGAGGGGSAPRPRARGDGAAMKVEAGVIGAQAAPRPARTPTPSPTPAQASAAAAVLYGLAGEYDGVELELGDEPIALGRDPRVSHLVFSSAASAVSGRHCAVWFDRAARAAMIEDFWSTNGTYLGDGRRLTGGVPQPLRSADQFYLGDPGVLFEVRY